MRKRKAIINIFFSLLLQFVTVIAGFIVPRLFIGIYGSEVNGLANSIGSFVGYITILQSGVGSVVKASLYKPLAQKDKHQLCIIAKTSDAFFNKIAVATLVYLGVLAFVFPTFIAKNFGWIYTASLVVIIGISTAAQYFFGITYQMILEADQKSYVYSIIQIITVIINTMLIVLLMRIGCSVQIVKGASAIVFVARPIVIGIYTKQKYRINENVKSDNSLINQRWDSFVQAIALFIHQKTDIFVLTLFASFSDVSIYSVYVMVTTGLSTLLDAIDKAVRSAFGNIIACDEQENLKKTFNAYNILMHMIATICFSTAATTIYAFIRIYTGGITDADYIQPVFGILIISAELVYVLRMPYNSIVYAAGKFRETKIPAGIEACINIILSCLLVQSFGLPGVAVGTLVAMSFRCYAFAYFLQNNILELNIISQIKRYFVTFINFYGIVLIGNIINISVNNYFTWLLYAACVFSISSIITIGFNFVVEMEGTKSAIKILLHK